MSNSGKIYYFVEGKCEKAFLDAFKDLKNPYFKSGRVVVFNIINKIFSNNQLMMLAKNATIVLVYDVDLENSTILDINVKKLKDLGFKKIFHIQSIRNFEDEIVRTTTVNHINEVFNTENAEQFKAAFLRHKNIKAKLLSIGIKLDSFWITNNDKEPFAKYTNEKNISFFRTKKNRHK